MAGCWRLEYEVNPIK